MVRKATRLDKERVIDIIMQTYAANPSYLATIKYAKNKNKSMRALATYVFNTSIRRNAIYFSSNGLGLAIWYRKGDFKESLADYWDQLLLVLKVIGIVNLLKTLKREGYIDAQRPADGNYLYFWFYSVVKQGHGSGAAAELKNAVFNEAKVKALPVYLETSVAKNKRVYERYGFKTYYTWYNPKEDLTRFFMRKEM